MPQEFVLDVREKIALCRLIHFYRLCEGLTARAAIDRINAERNAEQRLPFDAASEWYLAFAIGREEEADEEGKPGNSYVTSSYAWLEDPKGAPLIRALAYEAELKMELRELFEAAPEMGEQGAIQIDGIRRALRLLEPILTEAWRQRAEDTRTIMEADPAR